MLNEVDARALFRPLAAELLAVLQSLEPAEWRAPTSAGKWRVRDVVAHLLDGDIRRLSIQRDGHILDPPAAALRDYQGLVSYLNDLNAEWVSVAARMSSQVLTSLLSLTSGEVAAMMEAAEPSDEAVFPVAWAGQAKSPMWLDIGREYTERWHHQDQIREAVGAPPLSVPRWLRPVVELSLLALPRSYGASSVPREARIQLDVAGLSGGEWHLEYFEEWHVRSGVADDPACRVSVADLAFARLLHHRVKPEAIMDQVRIEGAQELATPLLETRAVMVSTGAPSD